jgi:MerR family transcriptional regulator, mercuric resistance operon regulatory protein
MPGRPITSARSQTFTPGELAARAQVHIESIRYFERIGLVPKADRTPSGHRRFGREHLNRLVFIRRARDMGFSQDEVRSLIGLSSAPGSCGEVRKIAEHNLRLIRDKIAGLRRLERLLSDTAAKCKGGRAPACPIIEALSEESGGG